MTTEIPYFQPAPTLSDEQINRLISQHEVHEYHPGALLEFSRYVIEADRAVRPIAADLRKIAEQAGICMDCWDMGAASLAYSAGCRGITREHLEKFAALYGFACWNAALEANPPNLNGFVSRAIAEAMKGSA